MKAKLSIAIGKLNNTILQLSLTYLYFNAYLLKSIFFGTGIIQIIEKQEKEMQLMYEETICSKLGLGRKFLQLVLYSR